MTSGTCISNTRHPETKCIQNSLYIRRVLPAFESFENTTACFSLSQVLSPVRERPGYEIISCFIPFPRYFGQSDLADPG